MNERAYQDAIAQSHHEALMTLMAAVVITAFFWSAVFWFEDSLIVWFGIPIWFWLSCIGGYFFSIAVVWLLISRCFKNFELDFDGKEQ